MKYKLIHTIIIIQSTILLLFLLMTFLNEIFDIPHYLLGDTPTTIGHRIG